MHRPRTDLPQPLSALPRAALRELLGVMTDIDDTLTTDGAITPDALQALHELRAVGLPVIAITGRGVGWSEPFASVWPVAAIVAENGAVMLSMRDGRLHTAYAQDAATRAANALRLQAAARQVLREVPGAALARDSAGRVTDIAIDHGEFARLDAAQIERAIAILRAAGLQASVSSIHINGWFGAHDKLSGARWAVRELLGRELDAERERWLWIGDSANDQALFGHLPLSVGVANLMRFRDVLAVWPRYLAQAERGAGFAEVARRVIAARRLP